MQIKVGERLGLANMFEDCVLQNCMNLQVKAQSTIDMVSLKKDKNLKIYIESPDEFYEQKCTSLEEAAIFETAAACLQRC